MHTFNYVSIYSCCSTEWPLHDMFRYTIIIWPVSNSAHQLTCGGKKRIILYLYIKWWRFTEICSAYGFANISFCNQKDISIGNQTFLITFFQHQMSCADMSIFKSDFKGILGDKYTTKFPENCIKSKLLKGPYTLHIPENFIMQNMRRSN